MPFEDPDPDPDGGLRRRSQAQVRSAFDEFARRFQRVLDETRESHGGRPASEIRPVLAARWSAAGGATLGEPRLSEYAEALSEGRRVEPT